MRSRLLITSWVPRFGLYHRMLQFLDWAFSLTSSDNVTSTTLTITSLRALFYCVTLDKKCEITDFSAQTPLANALAPESCSGDDCKWCAGKRVLVHIRCFSSAIRVVFSPSKPAFGAFLSALMNLFLVMHFRRRLQGCADEHVSNISKM